MLYSFNIVLCEINFNVWWNKHHQDQDVEYIEMKSEKVECRCPLPVLYRPLTHSGTTILLPLWWYGLTSGWIYDFSSPNPRIHHHQHPYCYSTLCQTICAVKPIHWANLNEWMGRVGWVPSEWVSECAYTLNREKKD